MRQLWGVIAGSLLLHGCADAEPTAIAEEPILFGVPTGLKDDAVLRLSSPSGMCSAALVAPNLVVTARHCVAVVEREAGLACNPDGTSANNKGLITRDFQPSEIAVYVGPGNSVPSPVVFGKQFFSTGSQTVCRNDLTFVLLSKALDAVPILPIRMTRQTNVGEKMSVVGFGQTEHLGDLVLRRRRDGLTVLRVGPNRFSSAADQAVEGTFVVGQGPCQGDSGGPALSDATGAIAGVYSIKATENCADDNATAVYVQLAEYYDLIVEAFDSAGAQPWLEGEPRPDSVSPSGCAVSTAGRRSHTAWLIAWGASLLGFTRKRNKRGACPASVTRSSSWNSRHSPSVLNCLMRRN